MKLLVIGGTAFLGRHVVEEATSRGHELTLFNRGKTNPGLFEGIQRVTGDRDGGLAPLRGRSFDAVVDTCGYLPRVVRQSAELLADVVKTYAFVSTVSVYADTDAPAITESDPLGEMEDPSIETIDGETYGPLKALCEEVVRETFGARALISRPGLIVGPHDPTDRFTYWPRRVARGGTVLAPGRPERPVQFIDARDVAAWLVHALEEGAAGTFNAIADPVPMGDLLATCRVLLNGNAQIEWIPDDFLLDHEVGPWMELPLWIPDGESPGLMNVDNRAAVATGMRFRPLEQIVLDTHAWDAARPDGLRPGVGLMPDREAELLEAWRAP